MGRNNISKLLHSRRVFRRWRLRFGLCTLTKSQQPSTCQQPRRPAQDHLPQAEKQKNLKKGGKIIRFLSLSRKGHACCVRDRQCPCALGLPILRAAAFSTFSTWRVALLRVIDIILHEKIQHEGSKCAAIRKPCPQELTWIKSAMVFPPGTVFILSSFK